MAETMQNHYLIKRSPDFTKNGVLVKRNNKRKGYSETVISSSNRSPASCDFKKGDIIYVAERGDFIYARGTVTELSNKVVLETVAEVFAYIKKAEEKDEKYWFDKLKKLVDKQEKNPSVSIKFQEYFIDQKLLDRTIPISGKLDRVRKPGMARSIIRLLDEEVQYINNPPDETVWKLDPKIPSRLRMDIFSLFNKEYSISHWIDIDHFVPKSSGGPGNIIENLVPVSMSLNRYKSDSVPNGFFWQAKENPELEGFVRREYLCQGGDFLNKKDFRNVIDDAIKINHIVNTFKIDEARKFYRAVLERHHPEYVKIIDGFK
jgi:hypothetical protein